MNLDAKPRVVYLLGAGASALALPMVSQIPEALDEHSKWLLEYAKEARVRNELIPGKPETERSQILGEYMRIIDDLKTASAKHESIDTYAKKLFLRRSIPEDQVKLIELKIGFSLFMAYLQTRNQKADKRYDGFLASLLTTSDRGGLMLPPEVLIINWNFDQQLALAFSEYQHIGSLSGAIEQMGMFPLEMLDEVLRPPPCRSIHLNGMFAYRGEHDEIQPFIEWNGRDEEVLLHNMMQFYAKLRYGGSMSHGRLMLRFAWEMNDKITAAFVKLGEVLVNCEALVVIGYSFPFFNRMIDREIIKPMKSLKKIYVQAPEKYAVDIARTVRTMSLPEGCEVELYSNTSKFLLPPEL